MKFARVVLAALFAALASASGFAFEVPALKGRVNDYAELLAQPERGKIEGALRALEEKTTVQVAILTVKDMQGEDIKSFSLKVAETWKLGQKGKDNGLLILYAVKEDRYRMEVGYGLEGAIPDALAGTLIKEMRSKADPKKGTKDFAAAFDGAVTQITAVVSKEYAADPSGKSMRKKVDGDAAWLVFCVAVLIAGVFGAMHEVAGAVVGGLEGAVIALFYAFSMPGLITLIVVGIFVGFIAKYILEVALEVGFAGGGSSGSSFGGGGGGFGGGGADG